LIAMQNPDATHVAGYRAWQAVGRQVMKGEKGLGIIAPRTGRCWDCKGEDAGCAKCRGTGKFTYFTSATVFDVSQTEGDPLPPNPMVPERLQGEDEDGWFARFAATIPAGWSVTIGPVEGSANGWTRHATKEVHVEESLAPAARLKTLVHELAHVALHGPTVDYHAERGRCECEAESVAYVVLGAIGIDSEQYSLGYVAGWTAGDANVVRATGKAVTTTARDILDAVLTNDEEDGQEAQDADAVLVPA